MARISLSKMHDQGVLTIFRGKNQSKSGPYIYEESEKMYGPENVAPKLIELEPSDRLPVKLEDFPSLAHLFDLGSAQKTLAIIEAMVSELSDETDFRIEYSPKYMPPFGIDMLTYSLTEFGGFKVDFVQSELDFENVIGGLATLPTAFLRVLVDQKFVGVSSAKLSPRLIPSFDSKRYVDTQVAMLLLMTSLSGVCEATIA